MMKEKLEIDELMKLTTFDAERFGQRVSSRRKTLKIKQTDLAEKLGITQQHMSGIEHAKDRFGFDVFLKLCIELRVNPDYLLGGTLRLSNVPQSIADDLNQCSPKDQKLAADIVELLRQRNQEKE